MSTDKTTKEDLKENNGDRPSNMGYGGRSKPDTSKDSPNEEE